VSTEDTRRFPEAVLRVLKVLDSFDCDYQVRSFNEPAHHAREAAELLNSPLGAIVKSLVFKLEGQEKYILVLVSGQNRVARKKITKTIGEQIVKAKPGEVLSITGYYVGAVPPFWFNNDLPVIIDEDLLMFHELWSSAGSAHILLNFKSSILKRIPGGQICDIKEM
jgi:prolyl-tRNA editing enzyme YbaK/EbsC (Cys-tRNA(Pro) deacylase)